MPDISLSADGFATIQRILSDDDTTIENEFERLWEKDAHDIEDSARQYAILWDLWTFIEGCPVCGSASCDEGVA